MLNSSSFRRTSPAILKTEVLSFLFYVEGDVRKILPYNRLLTVEPPIYTSSHTLETKQEDEYKGKIYSRQQLSHKEV